MLSSRCQPGLEAKFNGLVLVQFSSNCCRSHASWSRGVDYCYDNPAHSVVIFPAFIFCVFGCSLFQHFELYKTFYHQDVNIRVITDDVRILIYY